MDPSLLLIASLVAALALLALRLLLGGRSRPSSNAETPARRVGEPERRDRMSMEIVDRMAEGVLVLDEDLRPQMANRAARNLLGLAQVGLPDRLPFEDVRDLARRAIRSEEGAEGDVSMWFPRRRTLHVRASALADGSGVVVVIGDVTEAQRTQDMRREFVSHASHELKSPIASLHALADAVRAAVRDDPTRAEAMAARLSSEAERLGRLVTDLLDLSRLEEATAPPEQDVDLAAVARREVEGLAGTAEDKGIQVETAIAEGVSVRGDDQQLGLMLRNLLDNAIRYTPQGGTIRLDLAHSEGEAVLRVADTGVGIPRDAQERIFERFYRVDRARSRERGGTGLGLAIVKHAVELHRGRITLDSELGRGSTFTVHLPAVEPRRPLHSVAG
ncbi:MAG TPA: ATP-binding protein [Actinomycetota bacterium]|nr:ATP-binding protein [Actinomycetota bacterium]